MRRHSGRCRQGGGDRIPEQTGTPYSSVPAEDVVKIGRHVSQSRTEMSVETPEEIETQLDLARNDEAECRVQRVVDDQMVLPQLVV